MGAYGTTPATGMKVVSGLDAVNLTATTNGIVIDTLGFDGGFATFIVNVGTATGSGGEVDIKVQEDDNATPSSPTDVASATFTKIEVNTAATFDKVLVGQVQLLGRERYLRAVFTETVAVTGCPISCSVVLTGPGDSTRDVDTTYEFQV